MKAKITIKAEELRKKLNLKDGAKGDRGERGEKGDAGQDAPPVDTTSIALEAQKGAVEAIKPLIPVIVPETAQSIADKLNTEKEIVEKSVIIGLEDEIKKLREDIARIPRGRGGVAKTVLHYKLNSLLDGSTKTFTMPSKCTRIIAVMGSSFPNTFANDTDFTFNGRTLTFTNEITASSSLASGQTIIVIYESMFNV